MGLWRFLGGEINYDRVNKQINKEIKFQNELLEIRYKSWKKSDLSIEDKIKGGMQNFGEEFMKNFLNRYPNLVPDELNPFIEKTDLSENEKLKQENEVLKQKLANYERE